MSLQARVPRKAVSTPVTSRRDRFFTRIAALCVLFVVAGFTPTYLAPLATGSPTGVSPVVHIHGLLFFAWALFLLLQSTLVVRGRVALHRSLGLAGISLATAMVLVGFIVSLRANLERLGAGAVDRAYDLGFGNTVALIGFGAMVALAIANIRRSAHHKRWLLFATCMLLNPPLGRLYRALLAPAPASPWMVFLTVDAILVACLLHDRRTLGRPHGVTMVGVSVIVGAQILRSPIAATQTWRTLYDAILRLAA